ncbi:nucleotide pyrophosphatase [Bordetella avium]|uniref:nucleotide pyrophosphatase n=1 Tax=Bordetella avium TaxID=521 RepID=UPI00146AD756|nr:nucleotide pyrophosphatase [Bordetella avium]
MKEISWKRWCALLMATGVLAGCGGGDDDDNAKPATTPGAAKANKVLFVGVDGLTYDALRRGVADKSLANLGTLTLSRAWTGGETGAVTQQSTLIAPSWATLLTGQWADQHGVRSNVAGQAYKTPSLFERVKTAHPAVRSAFAANSSLVASMAGRDRDAGYLQALTDCAGVDDCVASQARDRINEGYDVVVAQFGAPEKTAGDVGFTGAYQDVLRRTDAAIGALNRQIADRRAAHPEENWLTVVVSSHGLGSNGTADGLALSANKTIVVATSLPAMLGASADDSAYDGVWDNNWYALPSAADVLPTVLAHLDANPADYDMAGTPLGEARAVRRLSTRTAVDNKKVTLSWVRVGDPADEIVISRDGAEIARLPGTASEYVDSNLVFDSEGLHVLNYRVSAGKVVTATQAKVIYAKPVPLLASLRNDLTMFFPFEGDLSDKLASGAQITAFDGVQQPAFVNSGVFGKMFKNDRSGDPIGAFKLNYTAGLLTTPNAFTIGFWYQSDGTANDRSIVGNKDYNSGANSGITIAQWAGPELRFNLASGRVRTDIEGVKFTPNKPIYIAMSVDKTAKIMKAYTLDPEFGFRSFSKAITLANFNEIAGLGPFLGLNEDGTGSYGVCCAGTKGPYTMYYDDLAFWSRVLTEQEIRSAAMSGKSINELFP